MRAAAVVVVEAMKAAAAVDIVLALSQAIGRTCESSGSLSHLDTVAVPWSVHFCDEPPSVLDCTERWGCQSYSVSIDDFAQRLRLRPSTNTLTIDAN